MKFKRSIGIVVLVALFLLIRAGVKRIRASKTQHPTVKTAVVERGDVISTVSASGVLKPFTSVDVKSKAGGRVTKMAVEEGTVVKPGQLICLIDPVDMRASYGQASADVNSAEAQVRQARENLRYQLSTLSPQIQEAAESVASARARLQQAKVALALQKQTCQTQIEEAFHALAAAKARLEQARQQAVSQPDMTQAAIAQAQASLKSAEENLRLLKNAKHLQVQAAADADVEQARSDVETTRKNLERMRGLLAEGFASQSQVDSAENAWIAARSRLQTALSSLNTLKEQQAAELADYEARVQQARAAVANAKANAVQDAVRQKDVEAAEANYRQAQAALTNAEANQKQVALKQEELKSAEAAARQAEAELKRIRASAIQNSVKEQDVQQAIARLTRARITASNASTNLAETTVVAPFPGVVLKKYVDEGTVIQSGLSAFSSGSPIVQLADTSRMYVDTQVDEADIALIEQGQSVSITLDAYPNSPKEGKVRKIFPQAEVEQNVTYIHVQVEIDPADVDERLRPEMNATCEFLVEERNNVLTVPSEAVKDVGEVSEVTVIKDHKKPLWDEKNQRKVRVETGIRGDERTEILSGLKEGDMVVTQIIQPIVAQPLMGPMGGPPRGAGRR